ncbi:hypothetical protein QMK38_16365 [Lysinibacillus fusiformis]|nr:hypothetical protein [Lysinibacillus fusiformis]
METDAFLQKINILIQMHSDGLLGGEIMPEDVLMDVVKEKELIDLIDELTMGMSLNYQRNSYSLWESVVKAYQDPYTKWIFDPSLVANKNIDELRQALLLHRVGLQPNRHPDIWQRVAKGIVKSSEQGNVQGLLESVQFDISLLKEIMQVSRKSEFPYLSKNAEGTKIAIQTSFKAQKKFCVGC